MSVVRAIQWQKTRAEAETLLRRIDTDAVVARQQRAKIARAKAERILLACDPNRPRNVIKDGVRKLPNKYTGTDADAEIIARGPVDNPLPRSKTVKYADNPLLWDAGVFRNKPEFRNVKVSDLRATQDYVIPKRVAQYLLPDDQRPEDTKKLTSVIRVGDEVVTINGMHRVVAYWLQHKPDIRVMDFGRWVKNGKWSLAQTPRDRRG